MITVTSNPVRPDELQKLAVNAPNINFIDITITDNGIGFERQYVNQIFEIFNRLHEYDVYPGSGIGLALCKRIVSNHKGYIHAESEVGKGSIFHIILPEKSTSFKFRLQWNYKLLILRSLKADFWRTINI